MNHFVYPWLLEFWWMGTDNYKYIQGKYLCCWFLSIEKVRTEDEIISGISKDLKYHSVYDMLWSNILDTKCFKPFIILSIFSLGEIRGTGINPYLGRG